MAIRILEVARIAAPERLAGRLDDARAKAVLAKLEAGRDATGGIAAGLDDLPLFAAAAPEPVVDPLAEALSAIEPDSLTPREALDALYRLKQLAP